MKKIAQVLYGSNNYGLNGPDSDKDYKVLLCPSFSDLYNAHKTDHGDLAGYDHDHYSPMDVRQFNSLLLKGNPNVVELLFSTEWEYYDEGFKQYVENARMLFEMGYLAFEWKNFYAATTGLVINSLKRYGNDNPKSVSRACYYFNMLWCLAQDDFRMTEETWRNNTFCMHAYNVRFQPENYNLPELAETVTDGLEKYKKSFSDQALMRVNWCNETNYSCAVLNKVAALKQEMFNFVKERAV